MDRVWLRDYEKMLSSNRRCVDVRPYSADISNNRVKKGRPERRKKKTKSNFISEIDVAKEILVTGTDVDEYERCVPEKQERLMFRRNLDTGIKKSERNKVPVAFQKLTTFEEFKNQEMRREDCFLNGNSEIFRELYPDIKHQMSQVVRSSTKVERPKSSPQLRGHHTQPFQITFLAEAEHASRPERPPAQFDKTLVQKALELWKGALTTLRIRGKEIIYEHVSLFSRRWKKSEALRNIATYISILLGVKGGDNRAIERALFRELFTLLKFFREVNPLTLPQRRLKKANSYYLENLLKGTPTDTNDKRNEYEMCIFRWVEAMQAIFGIIFDAKTRHDIISANFDENLSKIEAEGAGIDPKYSTPFKNLKLKRGESEKQLQHRLAKLSPTGTWSTRLTAPKSTPVVEEKSMGEGLSTFDSTGAQSFLEVSNSVNIPLDDLSLEYSPDKSVGNSPFHALKEISNYNCDPSYNNTSPCNNNMAGPRLCA